MRLSFNGAIAWSSFSNMFFERVISVNPPQHAKSSHGGGLALSKGGGGSVKKKEAP